MKKNKNITAYSIQDFSQCQHKTWLDFLETPKDFSKNYDPWLEIIRKIGIEHEKFLFNNNKRVDYSKVKEMFQALQEFGWKPEFEKKNIIGLNKGGKNISLEPGNQIELSGDKLNHMHEACA